MLPGWYDTRKTTATASVASRALSAPANSSVDQRRGGLPFVKGNRLYLCRRRRRPSRTARRARAAPRRPRLRRSPLRRRPPRRRRRRRRLGGSTARFRADERRRSEARCRASGTVRRSCRGLQVASSRRRARGAAPTAAAAEPRRDRSERGDVGHNARRLVGRRRSRMFTNVHEC